MSVQAVTVFCEDVRIEASTQETIVGAMADRVSIPTQAGMMPIIKMAMYTKAYFPVGTPPQPFAIRAVDSEGNEVARTEITQELMNQSYGARGDKPIYGIKGVISFGIISDQLPRYIHSELVLGDDAIVIGVIYFDPAPQVVEAPEDEVGIRKGRKRRVAKPRSNAAQPVRKSLVRPSPI